MTKTNGGISPGLLVVVIMAGLGLITALAVFISGGGLTPAVEPTPAPVTLPDDTQVLNARMIDFTLTTIDGRTISLSDFAGRPVFLNFWATWCPPCEREMPALQAFARAQMRQPDGAVVIAVNMGETAEQVQPFLDARGISSLIIPMDTDSAVSDTYGVVNLPVTFVIDRNGIVRYPRYGEVTQADLDAYLTALKDAETATPEASGA